MNKLPRVVESKINPQIFNLYFSLGVIVSCIIVYIILIASGETVTFTYLGILSGLLLAFAGVFTFAAIDKIGLSVGISIWSGTAILISFFEGVLGDKSPEYWGYAIFGVIILIIGVIGVAFSETTAQCLCFSKEELQEKEREKEEKQRLADPLVASTQLMTHPSQGQAPQGVVIEPASNIGSYQNGTEFSHSGNSSITMTGSNHSNRKTSVASHYDEFNEEMDISKWFLGIFYAMLTGIFGGSVGFPSTYTDSTNSGAKFLISFAVGVAVIFPITLLSQCFLSNEKIQWHFRATFLPGIISGILWNLGNLCSLYAINAISYAIAYPIMQSSLVVGVIWGIFVWKEFTDARVIGTIFFFALVVVVGCSVITYGVQG